MRIEEGKFYRTRDGRKAGPIKASTHSDYPYEACLDGDDPAWYEGDGTCPRLPNRDIVAEWTDEGPVRTETVRRLEPGVYGRLYVRGEGEYPFGEEKQAEVGFVTRGETREGGCFAGYVLTAPELRELARVALEIAEYLDAQ